MKALTVLIDEQNKFENEKVFFGKSALEACSSFFEVAEFLPASIENGGVDIIKKADLQTVTQMLAKIYQLAGEKKADFVVLCYADLPFVNKELTKRLVKTHVEYKCEYTFADGFPYGLAPELIDTGALGILVELSKTNSADEGSKNFERGSLYNLIKTDINSFDVEAELSDTDWRLLRFNLSCANKDSFLQCKNTFEAVKDWGEALSLYDAEKLCKVASECPGVLKTVPGFYNIQICTELDTKPVYEPCEAEAQTSKAKLPPSELDMPPSGADVKPSAQPVPPYGTDVRTAAMSLERFGLLCKKISGLSQNAVLNLGFLCEPLCHKDFLLLVKEVFKYEGLSVFFETSALAASEDFCQSLCQIVQEAGAAANGYQRLMVAVRLDAVSKETFAKVNGADQADFDMVLAGCDRLCKSLPGMVYPQFTRMNQNEGELEAFYRYWNEKSNPSGGNCIIQKYNDYSGVLPACKPADLSPLERDVCWHLRRDMTILCDGACVLCPNMNFSDEREILGNAFEDDLGEIWKKTDSAILNHINNNYCECCRKCDEYYTFNF